MARDWRCRRSPVEILRITTGWIMAIEEAEKQSVDYERPAGQYATRRQFRFLMILVIVNLAITIQSNYWPGLASSLKGQWTQYRERKRARALQQQAMNWTEPATKVVW